MNKKLFRGIILVFLMVFFLSPSVYGRKARKTNSDDKVISSFCRFVVNMVGNEEQRRAFKKIRDIREKTAFAHSVADECADGLWEIMSGRMEEMSKFTPRDNPLKPGFDTDPGRMFVVFGAPTAMSYRKVGSDGKYRNAVRRSERDQMSQGDISSPKKQIDLLEMVWYYADIQLFLVFREKDNPFGLGYGEFELYGKLPTNLQWAIKKRLLGGGW